ncbi:MAG TPA: hypothetical protein VEX63_04915 [Flavisolibacter sp.]|nr:hypothetical protein [Flavisolibacter sp.]
MLSIDIFDGDCFFAASPIAKSEQVAHYFVDLALIYQSEGIQKLIIYLDNNAAHKKKMKTLFTQLTGKLSIQVVFRYIAPYWPKLNLVEYGIHLIRQKITHHADYKTSLSEFESSIKDACNKKILSQTQIVNILQHIESSVTEIS